MIGLDRKPEIRIFSKAGYPKSGQRSIYGKLPDIRHYNSAGYSDSFNIRNPALEFG